jgi:hypothetical protein
MLTAPFGSLARTILFFKFSQCKCHTIVLLRSILYLVRLLFILEVVFALAASEFSQLHFRHCISQFLAGLLLPFWD